MELSNQQIEMFIQNLQNGPIASLKASKDLSTQAKAAIYRITKKIADSSETAAYLEQKQAFAEEMQKGEKTEDQINKEFQELLKLNSGLEVTKPKLNQDELLAVLSVDELFMCDWIFDIQE